MYCKKRCVKKITGHFYELRGSVVCSQYCCLTRLQKKLKLTKTIWLCAHQFISDFYNTAHTSCQSQWWRGDDLGLFSSHKTRGPLQSLKQP